jgi:minimal PKS acyl carrier protein
MTKGRPVSTFTLDDLITIMRECAGEDESVNLSGEIAEVDFEELGYDSLALMEAASRVQRGYHLSFPENELEQVRTPAAFVALVNQQLATSAPATAQPAG